MEKEIIYINTQWNTTIHSRRDYLHMQLNIGKSQDNEVRLYSMTPY